jgi:hypothetical protein
MSGARDADGVLPFQKQVGSAPEPASYKKPHKNKPGHHFDSSKTNRRAENQAKPKPSHGHQAQPFKQRNHLPSNPASFILSEGNVEGSKGATSTTEWNEGMGTTAMLEFQRAELEFIEAGEELKACKSRLDATKSRVFNNPKAILHLISGILLEKFSLPVGEVGKHLQGATSRKLSMYLKETHGGLKKFIEVGNNCDSITTQNRVLPCPPPSFLPSSSSLPPSPWPSFYSPFWICLPSLPIFSPFLP